MLESCGLIVMLLGSLFFLVSALGLLRMPDLFSRIHAGTKSSTLGTILVGIGAICVEPTLWFKLTLLILFILLTNPLSSTVLARSSYLKQGFLNRSGRDDLEEKE
jgi:multicomponent Na+:H+ antiporter subunit G